MTSCYKSLQEKAFNVRRPCKWTESGEEGEGQTDRQLFELAAGEIDAISLPAPDVSPEEILKEEVLNRRQRQRKRSGQYSDVERNW